MATIAIQAGELSGTSGLTLWVYLESTGVLQNTGGDSLSESPSSTGRFVATVAETLTGVMYCVVKDSGGYVVRDGYLDDGDTIVQPGYPSNGGGSGSDPLENAVPGSYAAGTAGYKLGMIGANASSVYAPASIVTQAIYQTKTATLTFTTSEDFTGYTATLSIRHRVTDASLLSKAITVTNSTTLTASLTATDTAFTTLVSAEEFGPHPYEISLVSGSTEKALPRGIVFIYKDLS